MNWEWFHVVAVFSVCLLQQGFALECYKCRSKRDEPCGYPTETNNVATEECPGFQFKCYHYDYNIEGDPKYDQYVERGCMSFFSECPSNPVEGGILRYQCKMCTEDKCNGQPTMLKKPNSGSSLTSALISVTIMLLVLIISV